MQKTVKLTLIALSSVAMLGGLGSCGTTSSSSTITACLASEPDKIDPALNTSVDGATYIVHAFSGLYGYKDVDGVATLEPACAASVPTKTTTDSGVTYDFTLRDDLKWSDGSKLDANDFVYSWNRAASGKTASDYAYMFDVIGNSSAVEADDTGTAKLAISASADGTHFFVTLPTDVPYFYELCAFPAYMPVKQSVVDAADDADGAVPGTWATDPSTYIGDGAYYLDSWTHDSQLVFKKNPYYYDADSVKTDEIIFALSDDTTNMYANFESGAYDMIDDMPLASLDAIKAKYPDEFHNNGQLGTYYLSWNVDATDFDAVASTEAKREEVRDALSLLIDRNHIVNDITKGGQTPANAFVATGLTDPAGGEFVDHNGPDMDGSGYFSVASTDFTSNCEKAVAMLKEVGYTYNETTKTFTDFPTFEYLYNTSDSHKAIAEYVQSAFASYGIKITLKNQDWSTFLNTRKDGNYTLARNGWLADYNDPISFLDMWVSSSGNDDCQLGKGDNATYAGYSFDLNNDGTIESNEKGLTWAQSYDKAIAMIKSESDTATRYVLMHKAETLLMSTGAITPIYNYTDQYLISTKIKGFFTSPLGYKFFLYAYKD